MVQVFLLCIKNAVKNAETKGEATIFGYPVKDPERFGVVSFDENGKAQTIEDLEKHYKNAFLKYFWTDERKFRFSEV